MPFAHRSLRGRKGRSRVPEPRIGHEQIAGSAHRALRALIAGSAAVQMDLNLVSVLVAHVVRLARREPLIVRATTMAHDVRSVKGVGMS